MGEQKIPGVRDAERPPISERTYGVLTAVAVVGAVAAILVAVRLPSDHTVDVVTFDLGVATRLAESSATF